MPDESKTSSTPSIMPEANSTTSGPAGLCGRCSASNALTRSHCGQCGARLPWIPAVASPPLPRAQTQFPPVKLWPFWAGEQQKQSVITSGMNNFLLSQWCLAADKRTGLAIAEASQKLCLLTVDNDQLHRRLFNYDDLLGSEIIEDGYIVASTSGSFGTSIDAQGQLPRGLAQKVVSGQTVKMVAFKLVFNALLPGIDGQPETLVHVVKFHAKEAARGSSSHKAALDKAQHWHRLTSALMHIENLKQSPLPADRVR